MSAAACPNRGPAVGESSNETATSLVKVGDQSNWPWLILGLFECSSFKVDRVNVASVRELSSWLQGVTR